jgi:MHS family proline/betaine transporter-like MFS transporter
VALAASMFVNYYVLFVFLITYLPLHHELSSKHAILLNGLALILQTIVMPIPALFSRKWGQKKIFYGASLLTACLVYPSFMLFKLHQVWISLAVLSVLGMISTGFYIACSIVMIEAFPLKYRLSGTAISYNTAAALFGGTAPMITTLLVSYTSDLLAPAYYLIFWSLIGMIGMFFIQPVPDH